MEWTRLQRNELFQAVQTGGLDPSDCELVVGNPIDIPMGNTLGRSSGSWRRANDRNTDSYHAELSLTIRVTASSNVYFEVAYQRFAKFFLVRRQRDEEDWLSLQDWREVLEWVTGWAREVALISSPDMWEQSALRRQLVSAEASADENTPFSQTELAEIAAQLKAMREELREQGKLSAAMDAKLDEAEKASRRLGRKDWYSWFIGTMTGLMIAGTVTPDVGQHVMVTVLSALAHLFGAGPVAMLPGG